MFPGSLVFLVTITVSVFTTITCVEPVVPLAQSQPIQQGDCIKYLLPGKGDFKIEKKRYGTQKPDYYIASLEIKQRTSFYKCTPQEFKYGIDVNSKTWWVDKGCEGIFEVRECHDNPGWKDTVYSDYLKYHDKPVAINSLHEWKVVGTENRFDHPDVTAQ